MNNRLALIAVFFLTVISNGFSQNLPPDRMQRHRNFAGIIDNFSGWYYNFWIANEFEYIDEKIVQEMRTKIRNAQTNSTDFFRDKVHDDPYNFRDDVKIMLEQLYTTEYSIINEWAKILSENGYLTDKNYNNVERFSYEIQFLINSCMLYDQEFLDNTVTDSIIEKVEKNFNEIRQGNS